MAFGYHCCEVVFETWEAEDVGAGEETVALGALFGFEADRAGVG